MSKSVFKTKPVHLHRMIKHSLITLTLGTLAAAPVFAAKSDLLDSQGSGLSGLGQAASPEAGSGSILQSLKGGEDAARKDDYFQVLNLIKQNKVADAKKRLAELLKKSPNEAELYNLQALVLTMENDRAGAQKQYQKAIELNKNNIVAYLGLSKLLLESGDLDKSKTYADQALGINEKSFNAYFILADIAMRKKNIPEVEKILQTAHDKVKGNINPEVEVIRALGQFYMSRKQPEKVLALAEDLAKNYPDSAVALTILSQAQVLNNKTEDAAKTLQILVERDKKDIGARLTLVKLWSNQPDKEKDSFKMLDEAIAIDSKNPEPALMKGAYLIKLNRTKEALEVANKMDAQYPKLPLGKILQGDVYLSEKNLDKAIAAYQQAYKLAPAEKVLFTIVDLLNAQGKTAESVKFLDRELAIQKNKAPIHFKLATVYQAQNDYAQAEKHYKAILVEQADNVLALNNLAWVYSQQNSPQALEYAKKAYDKAGKLPAVADTYGAILTKQGKAKEALSILEAAAAQAPQSQEIQYHLAEAFAATDKKAKAIEILEALAKGDQNFQGKAAAAELLSKLKAQ